MEGKGKGSVWERIDVQEIRRNVTVREKEALDVGMRMRCEREECIGV